MREQILAHCYVLYGQGKTKDQTYLMLIEKYGNANYCSDCIIEVFGF